MSPVSAGREPQPQSATRQERGLRSPDTPQKSTTNVLVLSPHAADHVRLREMFRKHRVRLLEALTLQEGIRGLLRHRPEVVICEAILPDGDWKLVLGQTSPLKNAPKLIVISSHATESLWVEILNLGGYDLLAKPLVEDEVVRVVGLV